MGLATPVLLRCVLSGGAEVNQLRLIHVHRRKKQPLESKLASSAVGNSGYTLTRKERVCVLGFEVYVLGLKLSGLGFWG